MNLGTHCPLFMKEEFKDGITNGAAWYAVTGGMQDWNYVAAGCFELTLEVGCSKFPKQDELPGFWTANREALVKYIEQVHRGIHGFIKSSIGTPIANAAITLNDIKHVTYSSAFGDYFKLVLVSTQLHLSFFVKLNLKRIKNSSLESTTLPSMHQAMICTLLRSKCWKTVMVRLFMM